MAVSAGFISLLHAQDGLRKAIRDLRAAAHGEALMDAERALSRVEFEIEVRKAKSAESAST